MAYGAHRALDAHAAGSLSSSLGLASLVRVADVCVADTFSCPCCVLTRAHAAAPPQRDPSLWTWLPVRRINDEEVAAREKAYALRVAAVSSGGGVPPDDGGGAFIRLQRPAQRGTLAPPAAADTQRA